MPQIEGKDIIAFTVIVGFVVMELAHVDGEMAPAVLMIVGFYFGHVATLVKEKKPIV